MNTKERILSGHFEKTLNEPLSDLSLFQSGKLAATGTGKLSINVDGQLLIEAIAEVTPHRIGSHAQRGVIIPDAEYYDLIAKTCDGLTVKADKLVETSIRYSDKPTEVDFKPTMVTISSSRNTDCKSSFEVFASPYDCRFYNKATRQNKVNPVFEDSTIGRWFGMEKTDVVVGLRGNSNSRLHLRVNSKIATDESLEKHAAAFLDVLKFSIGKELECLAHVQIAPTSEKIVLFGCESTKPMRFYPPIPDHEHKAAAKLLERGMDFFLRKDCGPVLTALHVCWESRKITFPANCLLVCSVVEGLADYILRDAINQCHALRDLALELLRKESKSKESPYFHEVEKNIKSVEFLKSKESIRKAAELLRISVTPTELGAWGHLRNRLAHGNIGLESTSRDYLQIEFDRAAAVANIANKFILALIGYDGPYRNYAERGHPIQNFPA